MEYCSPYISYILEYVLHILWCHGAIGYLGVNKLVKLDDVGNGQILRMFSIL